MRHTLHGDVLALAEAGHFDVIVHGCNCQCVMGAGIAKQIKERFPSAYQADLETKHIFAKLGAISYSVVQSRHHELVVVNGYTQLHWRGRGVKVNYHAIRSVMQEVRSKFGGKRIAYPRIGAGLAGGDWQRIALIIDEVLDGEDHTLVEYAP